MEIVELVKYNPIAYKNSEIVNFLTRNSDCFVLGGGLYNRRLTEDQYNSYVDTAQKSRNFSSWAKKDIVNELKSTYAGQKNTGIFQDDNFIFEYSEYKELKPFLIKGELGFIGYDYFFEINDITTKWLAKRDSIYRFTEPINSILFYKGDKAWAYRIGHNDIYYICIDEHIEKELAYSRAIAQEPFMNFIRDVESSRRDLHKYPAKFFLNQFDYEFLRIDWDNKIKDFYKSKDNLRLFTEIIIEHGIENLSDEELYLAVQWLADKAVSESRQMSIDMSWGGNKIFEFFLKLSKDRFLKLFNEGFKKSLCSYDKGLAKNLIRLFKELNYKTEEIENDILRQAFLDLTEETDYEISELIEQNLIKTDYRFSYYRKLLTPVEIFQDVFRSIPNCRKNPHVDLLLKAQNGDLISQKKAAYFYYVNRKNKKAVFWLKKVAQAGDPDCQYDLAKCYLAGKGVPKSIKKARFWFDKAAEQDNKVAQVKLLELNNSLSSSRFP